MSEQAKAAAVLDMKELEMTNPAKRTKSVSFETTLAATGNNTGIVIPVESIESLGAGKKPPVVVNLNGHEYRSTVGVMRGQHMVSVSAAIRKQTGLQAGDAIKVTLTVADAPRAVSIPEELEVAFNENPQARGFFDGLSNSIQRYHADNVAGSKNAETRQRRAEKAIALFLAGKPRCAAGASCWSREFFGSTSRRLLNRNASGEVQRADALH